MSTVRFPASPRGPAIAEEIRVPASGRRLLMLRIAVALAAIAVVALAMAALVALLPPSPAPVRSPFGAAFREAAPGTSGLGAYLLALQSRFYLALQAALIGLKNGGSEIWPLIGIGFAYGVFHAAGPGHGKAVIAAYLASGRSVLRRGIVLSTAAAFIQACTAFLLVGTVFLALKGTAATMSATALLVERASFLAMAGLGAILVWRKAGFLAGAAAPSECGCAPGCGHAGFGSLPSGRRGEWREMAGIALAAGIRPCAGALVLLVFAMSQGLVAAGIAAVFAMAAGTALTTGAIAALTVSAKALAVRLFGAGAGPGSRAIAAAELLAAAFVLVLGVTLLIGLWRGDGAI